MPAPWGIYKRPEGDEAALPADDEARARYKAKGFKYLRAAPQPGMEEATAEAKN